jgi:CubicO group peptidase (beta-lactamase class C family)
MPQGGRLEGQGVDALAVDHTRRGWRAKKSARSSAAPFWDALQHAVAGELPVLGVRHPAAQRAVDGPDIRPGAGCGDVTEWLANEGGFGGGEWPGHQARAVVLTCVAAVAPPGSPSACGAASRVIRDDRQLHWHDAEMADDEVLTLLGAALADLEADGVAMGVVVGDQVEFVYRGRRGDERVDRHTAFYGASVTKQIVGVLLARVIVDRAADVDDLVLRWLPELPDWTGSVRLGHLIHHTSGLPDVTDPALGIPRSNADVIERFQRLQPFSGPQPGVRYAYNNAGYVLLAEALTRILKRPISEIASTELFIPLALTDTQLGGKAVQLPVPPDPPGTVGDGGLWTSIADLTSWLRACNMAEFGASAQRLAETTTQLVDGSHLDYAWGVRITPAPYGRLITHGGSWQRWLAKTVRIPERQVAVAILSVDATEQAVSDTGTQLAEALASR